MTTKIFHSEFAILIAGIFCLGVAFFLAINMYRTRRLQRSAAFMKCEFALLGVLLLIFIRDMCQFLDVRIEWLVMLFEWVYTPVLQVLIGVAVIYLTLYINDKYKRQKLI